MNEERRTFDVDDCWLLEKRLFWSGFRYMEEFIVSFCASRRHSKIWDSPIRLLFVEKKNDDFMSSVLYGTCNCISLGNERRIYDLIRFEKKMQFVLVHIPSVRRRLQTINEDLIDKRQIFYKVEWGNTDPKIVKLTSNWWIFCVFH